LDGLSSKIDLGCGLIYKKGYLRVDINPKVCPDKIIDLENPRWDLPYNHFNVIECDHVIEHFKDSSRFLYEIINIAKDGAKFRFNLPHYTHAWSDPDHKRAYGLNLLSFYTEYQVKNVRLGLITDINNKSYTIKTINTIINSIVNIRPYLFERFGYIVGGYMNMTIEGIIKK
jgi:hypothetical protein